MTAGNWLVLLIFGVACAAFIAAIGVWDVWLARRKPGRTISWSMALLARQQPLFVFWIGFLVATVVGQLAEHFWPSMDSVDLYAQNEALQAQVRELTARILKGGAP